MAKRMSLDEQYAIRLRQRLWGAAVLIALAVILLPLLLDGSGSESQYRRVERLRHEPPSIIDKQGKVAVMVIEEQTVDAPETDIVIPVSTPDDVILIDDLSEEVDDNIIEEIIEEVAQEPEIVEPAPVVVPSTRSQPRQEKPISAWVVQAGSFKDEINAIEVRDRLRANGFPSFVTPTDSQTPVFRVRVGPIIDFEQAERKRVEVVRLLGRKAIVVSYP